MTFNWAKIKISMSASENFYWSTLNESRNQEIHKTKS